MLRVLKNCNTDAPAMDKMASLVECIRVSENPSGLGERKHGAHKHCHGAHLAKSAGLVYSIDYASRTAWILDVGDHKRPHGRDDRS